MRLIDADALYDIVMNYIKPMTTNEAIILQDFIALVEDAPTVDTKPVVRCKDCIYQAECVFTEWLGRNGNGFCSSGERR